MTEAGDVVCGWHMCREIPKERHGPYYNGRRVIGRQDLPRGSEHRERNHLQDSSPSPRTNPHTPKMASTRALCRLATSRTGTHHLCSRATRNWSSANSARSCRSPSRLRTRIRLRLRHQGSRPHFQGGRNNRTRCLAIAHPREQDVDRQGARAGQGCEDEDIPHLPMEP